MTRSTRTSRSGVPRAPSLRSRLAATATEYGLRPISCAVPMNPPGILFARTLVATIMELAGPPLPGTAVQKIRTAGVRGAWVRAPGVRAGDRAVYYVHGSGHVLCSARTHRGLASRLSRDTGLPVFVVDYRLAPEHRFPAAAGFEWLRSRARCPPAESAAIR